MVNLKILVTFSFPDTTPSNLSENVCVVRNGFHGCPVLVFGRIFSDIILCEVRINPHDVKLKRTETLKGCLHVTFLARFSYQLKWVKCSPMEVFTHDVKRSKVPIIKTG